MSRKKVPGKREIGSVATVGVESLNPDVEVSNNRDYLRNSKITATKLWVAGNKNHLDNLEEGWLEA